MAGTGKGRPGLLEGVGQRGDPAPSSRSWRPVTWTDTLLLINTAAGWRVDDIAYGAGFQFGNTGKLTDTLKTVLREAP